MKDLYKLLNVSESATSDDIKKSFRKMAMECHPDRHTGKDAEAKFKEINEAYTVLSDAEQRAAYDQQRKYGHGFTNNASSFDFRTNFGGGNFHDIFEQMFRGDGNFTFGVKPSKNADTVIQLNISLEDVLTGKQIPVQFTDSSEKLVNINVNIPAGIESGTRMRYAGNGSRTNPKLPPGDLLILINVEPHARFERHGAHVLFTQSLSIWESLVGVEKSITTLDGTTVKIQIPSMSSEQTVLRVPNKGLPTRSGSNSRGDLLVRVQITAPTLTDEQKTIIKSWI